MKQLLFVAIAVLSFAVSVRADGSQVVGEFNALGTISITNGVNTESIVFDAQLEYLSAYPGNLYGTLAGPAYEISTGPLGDFSDVNFTTSGPTYLGFFDAAGDEIDLEFKPSETLTTPVADYAYVWRCNSQACSDNFSINGNNLGIYYYGTFDVSVTAIPVTEPGEIGMLLFGIIVVVAFVALARSHKSPAALIARTL